MNYKFHPKAEQEFDSALSFYNNISPRLAARFYQEFYKNLQTALANPYLFAQRQNFRNVHLGHFPYVIYFRMKAGTLLIAAIFHTKRNPATITSQIKDRY